MKIVLIFALFCFAYTFGKVLPTVITQVPLGGQNISTQGIATSTFSFGGLIFMTMAPSQSTTTLMAFNNDTYEFIQKEELASYQCFNPEYCLNSNDATSFFLVCSSAPNISGFPVVWVIRPIQGLFFRVVMSDYVYVQPNSNWTWIITDAAYIWNMDTSVVQYIYTQSSSNSYIYVTTLTYGFDKWSADLADFTWTSMSIISAPLTLFLTGQLQGVQIFAVLSSSGQYSLVSGSFDSVSLLYNGNSILGMTTSPSSTGTVLSLWDFSKLSSAKPRLIKSLSFNSSVSVTPTTLQDNSNLQDNNLFVTSLVSKILTVTQVTWSTGSLIANQFYYGPYYPLGFSANSNSFFIFNVGFATRYPY